MAEGSLDAPVRHPLDWQNPDFTDPEKIDAELRRVFDICHGCRRCFNLCDSFPRLFDLIDESETGELDSVDSKDFQPVIDACTLCDMCFMTKCPYVPPHEFNLDFPHLMLRARTAAFKRGETSMVDRQLTKTDRNGKLGCACSGVANWATKRGNGLTRGVMQATLGLHKDAELPQYAEKPFVDQVADLDLTPNPDGPAKGRKVALFATCFSNFNKPEIGLATAKVLAKQGCEVRVVYPGCCGMPQLEHGDLEAVAASARAIAAELGPLVQDGWDIIALVSSCALMMKFEWPLILPDNADLKRLAGATSDVSEYVVGIAKREGLADGMRPLEGGIAAHMACHARAQNMGQKSAEMLRLIPDAEIKVIERCSGHGGSWGVMKENFDVAIKVGKPVARQAAGAEAAFVVSECPLARDHIVQGMEAHEPKRQPEAATHPIEVMARTYGLT